MMRKTIPLILLVVILAACDATWLWRNPTPQRTPQPTPTQPEVEDAGRHSPNVEGRLLYARSGHIWVRSGTIADRLTRDLDAYATQPCWSPDGRQIAFVVLGNSYSNLWIMNADGHNPHPITDNQSSQPLYTRRYVHSSYWAAQPQWVARSEEMIYYLSHHEPRGNYTSQLAIWEIRPNGSEKSRYLSLNGHIENPAWSPNGQHLAFTFFTAEDGAQLRYWNTTTGSLHTLGEEEEGIERYDPAWSPDGQWISYTSRRREENDLWLMPSPLNPLYDQEWEPIRLTELGTARNPAWSPDGQQIAFVAATENIFDLWLLTLEQTADGTPEAAEVEQLTTGGGVDATARPSWIR